MSGQVAFAQFAFQHLADMTAGKLGSEPHVAQALDFADARVDECLDILRRGSLGDDERNLCVPKTSSELMP
jgi:hypothetical protein